MKIKIKKNGKYLVESHYSSGSSSIHKISIEDETKTCYFVFWEDLNKKSWERKDKFKKSSVAYGSIADYYAEYEIIEDLGEKEESTETLKDKINNTLKL